MQFAGCTVACDGMFLWCVQEVAELKEEDIISGKLRTAAAGVSEMVLLVHNENQQGTSMDGNTIDLLTDNRSLHQWLLWQTIASSASCR